MTAETKLSELVKILCAQAKGDGYIADCPLCGKKQKLSINMGDRGILMHCYHCGKERTADILSCLGLPPDYLFDDAGEAPPPSKNSPPMQKTVAKELSEEVLRKYPEPPVTDFMTRPFGDSGTHYEYCRHHIYRYPSGTVFGCKVIFTYMENGERKKRVVWHHNNRGHYRSGLSLMAECTPLYNAHLIQDSTRFVFITEGEKDADTVNRFGITAAVAVSLPNGAGQSRWADNYNIGTGRSVFILTDNDEAGANYGRFVAHNLYINCICNFIKIISATAIYPDAGAKWDVTDIAEKLGEEKTKTMLGQAMTATQEYQETAEVSYTVAKKDPLPDVKKGCLLADVKPEKHEFLWYPYIPRRDLTVIVAPPGAGKTYLTVGISTAVTNGKNLPGESGERKPGRVLIITSEEEKSEYRNRFENMNADLNRIIIYDQKQSFSLTFGTDEGIADIRKILEYYKPDIVFIDPWQGLMQGVNINHQVEVRKALTRVKIVSAECNCSIVLLSHVNKRAAQQDDINNAASGSSELINVARSVLYIHSEPETEERHVVHSKSSYAPFGTTPKFKIEGDGDGDTAGKFVWDGFSLVTKYILDTAGRERRPVSEIVAKTGANSIVANAIINYANDRSKKEDPPFRLRYSEFEEIFPNILTGRKPAVALRNAQAIINNGGWCTRTTVIKYRGADGKFTTERGFEILKIS